MHTIVLATQKGGSGKSTLAIGLALAAKEAGHHVRLIEADQQGTLSRWQIRRGIADLLVETIYGADEIEPRLRSLARHGATLAIIDTAGGVSAATTAAIRHADFCLIPARPCVADIEASAGTLTIARAWKKAFAFVLNQTPIRGQRIANAAEALGNKAARELDQVLARPFIVMRNDHQDALAAGLAVSEFSPFGKSADEIRDLWKWVELRLNGGVAASREVGAAASDVEFPIVLSPEHLPETAPEEAAPQRLQALGEGLTWDAGL
ncbi:MAG TPA: ParA family protein [Bradyrhizobium sp.]|uniref:ParA family protein n=1 Tax=Bradyrhizobium sp. TaxID=376 RepID=UPI002BA728B3|nr:ParA family protein [Bradyrhizobium sp.]HLZ04393.1 ParA family protein [Bradyrhizobium sp.]